MLDLIGTKKINAEYKAYLQDIPLRTCFEMNLYYYDNNCNHMINFLDVSTANLFIIFLQECS